MKAPCQPPLRRVMCRNRLNHGEVSTTPAEPQNEGHGRALSEAKPLPEFRDKALQNFRLNFFAIHGGIPCGNATSRATSLQWKFLENFSAVRNRRRPVRSMPHLELLLR